MLIRLATIDDLDQVMGVVRSVVPLMQASGNPQWTAEYPNHEIFARDVEAGQLWVAQRAEKIVGVVAHTNQHTPEYADVGWDLAEEAVVVHRLAVDPAVRGKGVALALMSKADGLAAERGTRILRADTNKLNLPMQTLFVKLGYELSGEVSFNGREGLRFLCYEKRLLG